MKSEASELAKEWIEAHEDYDRLCKAAPEMLEALEFIAADCAGCLCSACMRYKAKAEAAIQKARS